MSSYDEQSSIFAHLAAFIQVMNAGLTIGRHIITRMQRRMFLQAMLAARASFAAAPSEGRLLMQAYVWQQWAATNKKKLGDAAEEIFAATARAGFRRLELTSSFFAREVREQSIRAIEKWGMDVPIVYQRRYSARIGCRG